MLKWLKKIFIIDEVSERPTVNSDDDYDESMKSSFLFKKTYFNDINENIKQINREFNALGLP